VQLSFKLGPVVTKTSVVQNFGGNAHRLCLGQPTGLGPVGQHQTRPPGMGPSHILKQPLHITAATRNQNSNV
jgi:hypothetical protein